MTKKYINILFCSKFLVTKNRPRLVSRKTNELGAALIFSLVFLHQDKKVSLVWGKAPFEKI